jgi:hypothetical protein
MSSTIAVEKVLIDPAAVNPATAKIAKWTAKYAKESSSEKLLWA